MKPLFALALCCICLLAVTVAAAEPTAERLWPAAVPGERATLPPEIDTTKPDENLVAGQRVIRLGQVSNPTISFYPPTKEKNTGAAVLVCPGGGYNILAMDLEGTEVCEWLQSIGVTGVLLKYRVPRRAGLVQHGPPLQDAQRALGLIRHQADSRGIDPQRIGVLGFSAGGHLAAVLSNVHDERSYPPVDAADEASCRPDFSVLIYPGYLASKVREGAVAPELRIQPGATPPTFLAMSQDDPVGVENALVYYAALQQAKVAAELHLYPRGGHGYGLRRTTEPVTTWPDRVTDWMKASGWLKSR